MYIMYYVSCVTYSVLRIIYHVLHITHYIHVLCDETEAGGRAGWPQQPHASRLALLQAKPSRLHCSHCDETYTLPQNGTIKLYKELRCPLDDFELVLWSSGSRGKSYPLCPYCSNHPPFRDMKKGERCIPGPRPFPPSRAAPISPYLWSLFSVSPCLAPCWTLRGSLPQPFLCSLAPGWETPGSTWHCSGISQLVCCSPSKS